MMFSVLVFRLRSLRLLMAIGIVMRLRMFLLLITFFRSCHAFCSRLLVICNNAYLFVIRIMTIEGRGGAGVGLVGPKFVAGDLFADEAVVRLVIVERFDDVIAITPGIGSRLVGFEPFAFGVARQIQPMPRPAFAVMRR